jgi:hypothetical protein
LVSSRSLLAARKPVLVNDIRFSHEPDGRKRIYIEFDHYEKPLLACLLKGGEPQVRISIQCGKMSPDIPKSIDVAGKFVRRIRTVLDRTNDDLNIILDLQPRADCQVNYVHYLGMNLFCVDISCRMQDKPMDEEKRIF